MRFLKNIITIVSEIAILLLSIIWYFTTCDYEPLIAVIVSFVGLITSLISRCVSPKPKIELHNEKTDWGRNVRGYTKNNPPIIRVGVDNLEQYWELFWNFKLEIRNNSSINAYSIEFEYENVPPKTIIEGSLGKIEPLLANEKREFRIRIIQNITGNHIDADNYLKTNISDLMQNTKIIIRYKNEHGATFHTEYDWLCNSNKFK